MRRVLRKQFPKIPLQNLAAVLVTKRSLFRINN